MSKLGVPLAPVRALGVLEALRRAMQVRSVKQARGLPVDVLTPRDCPLHRWTLVAPKDDGESRLMLFGKANAYHGMSLFFIDRAMRVFDAGHIPSRDQTNSANSVDSAKRMKLNGSSAGDSVQFKFEPRRLSSFIVDGEFLDATFRIVDVLMYKSKPCIPCRPFIERYKFTIPILGMIPRSRVRTLRGWIRVEMKPFFGLGAIEHVNRMCQQGAFAFPTDGLVFLDNTRPFAKPKKFKPVQQVTCDFILHHNCDLFIDAGEGRLVFVDRVDQSRRSSAADAVVECKYVVGAEPIQPLPDTALPEGRWEVVRVRQDKKTANFISVFHRNCALIAEDFTFQKLLASLQLQRAHQNDEPTAAEDGYFAASAIDRRRSLSVRMKGFHGSVKDAVYKRYSSCDGVTQLLELGIGRGADLFRINTHAKHMLFFKGVDIDAQGLREARRRWNLAARSSDQNVEAVFSKVDLSNAQAANRLKLDHFHQFHLVSAHFCVHYFLDLVPRLVAGLLTDDGHFVCSIMHGGKVRECLRDAVSSSPFKREWRINGVVQTSLQLCDDHGAEVRDAECATHVAVFVDTIGRELLETLVDVDAFIRAMGDEGLECMDNRPFTSFPSDFFLDSDPMFSFSELYSVLVFRKRKTKKPWEL